MQSSYKAQPGVAPLALVLVAAGAASLGGFGTAVYRGLLGDNPRPFFEGMVRNPLAVGALAPCSTAVAQETASPISQATGHVRVLEVGGGTGQLTAEIQKTLQKKFTEGSISGYDFDVVELDDAYCMTLRRFSQKDPQVAVHCVDVTKFNPETTYDFIVSSLPFSNMPKTVVMDIVRAYERMITPGGVVTYIQLIITPLKRYFIFGVEKQEWLEKMQFLDDFRARYNTREVIVNFNIPPIRVYHITMTPSLNSIGS